MKVPLIAYHSGRILVVAGKEKHTLLQPFPPYYITSDTRRKGKKGKLMDLGKKKLVSVRKVEFGSSGEAAERATNLRNDGKGVQYLSYLETLFVDRPDFFRDYPNGEPDIMSLDIEVYTDGSGIFPRAETSPIISIGVMYARPVDGVLQEEEPVDFQATKEEMESDAPDRRILLQFLQYLKDKNPDVILTYNGIRFDIPYIISRCNILGITLDEFSRVRAPWETRYQPRIPGHIHYDLYATDVDRDQSLCYDRETEVLTDAGWKYFKDVSSTDKVATLNIDRDELEFQKPSELTQYQYAGKMYSIKSKEIDLLVTPNHDLLVDLKPWNKYEKGFISYKFAKPSEVFNKRHRMKKMASLWRGRKTEWFILPQIHRGKYDHNLHTFEKFNMDTWLEFLGYYLSEGSLYHHEEGGLYVIQISQNPGEKSDKIINCIRKLGFEPNVCKRNITIKSKQIYSYLSQFGKCNDKFIPKEYLELSVDQLQILYEALMLGDGAISRRGKSGYMTTSRYSTTSLQLADNFQELLLKIGKCGNIIIDDWHKNRGHLRKYSISVIEKQTNPIINQNATHDGWIDYDDKVYCCTAPNQILYVRRNGYPVWSGNSGIKNKKLKTVAGWFNISVIQLDGEELSNMSKLVGTKRLREYQHSDVKVLVELYKIYSPTHVALAEMLGIPLDSIINDYPSFVPKIISARKLRRAGYVALDTNRMRYRGMDAKYQAAYVDILKHGYIPKVWKMDFSGFYPSTMVNFNISPETTSIVRMDKFTSEDDFKFKLEGDILWCQIPDKNLRCNIIIEIDQSKPGLISEELRELMEMRFKLKREMKGKSLDETARIMALTDAQKIIINSIYGVQGLSSTEFGDMSAAISIVGICRWIMKKVVEKYHDIVIEVDSVTGQTPVCIRRNQKYIDFIPIEELIPIGYTRYYNIPKNVEVLTRNGWKKIEYVKRHRVRKQIYRINTTNGYVEATEDHSLFTKDKQEITPKNLLPGDEIEIVELPESNLLCDISEDFAWFLGFLLAEGSVTVDNKPRYQIVFSNQNLDYLDRVNKIFESRYMTRMNLYDTRKSSNCYKLEKDHKFAATELKHLCYTKGNRKKVPLQILNGPEKTKKAFLKGLWDGDGHISITKKQHVESLDSVHHTLFAGVQYILNSAGQKTGVVTRDDKTNVLSLRKKMSRSHNVFVNQHIVKKIKELTSEPTCVYDISTEDGTFVCGIGGLVLHNTDGIYIDSDVDVDEAEKYVTSLVRPITKVEDLLISLDKDTYGSGFFHLSKNYLLRELKEGKIIFHGVALKSSSHCLIYDRILNTVAELVLEETSKEDIWNEISKSMDLSQYELKDFIITMRLNKPMNEYVNENCLQRKLGKQVKNVLGIDPYPGIQIEYLVTRGRMYKISADVEKTTEVDHKYYTSEIYKVLKIFGLDKIHQGDLFE